MIYVPCMYIFGYTITLSTYIVNTYIYIYIYMCDVFQSRVTLHLTLWLPRPYPVVSCRMSRWLKPKSASISVRNICRSRVRICNVPKEPTRRGFAWSHRWFILAFFWCFNCFSFKNIFTQHLPSKIWMRSEWHLNDILDNLRVFSDSFQTEKDRGAG